MSEHRVVLLIAVAILVAPALSAEPGDPIDLDWISKVTAEIADTEYHVTWQEASALDDVEHAWHAPNRAQDLRTYFTPDGIRVVPRTGRSTWTLALSLVRWGRPDTLIPVGSATALHPEDNRIELDRGAIVEWYVNDRDGLEQGFTIEESPPSDRGPLVLDLALSGGLRAGFSDDGQAVELLKPDNRLALRYAKLVVEDALGERLPAHIEGFAAEGLSGLRLVVDDRGARYPILVDPLITTASWTQEGDQALAFFGISVATAGDVDGDGDSEVVVGAYQYDNGHENEGRAFVYNGSSDGLTPIHVWSQEGNQIGASFGYALAAAGDVNGDGYADLIVGAPYHDQGQTDEGKVYVYHGSASGLSSTPDWEIDSNGTTAWLGQAVGTAGDVNGDGYADVIIGGPGYDNVETDEGRAWLYHGSASGLLSTAAWSIESDQAGAQYGWAVGTAGDVNGDGYADIFVSAERWDEALIDRGKVWVHHGSATGVGSAPDWEAQGDQAGAQLGYAVGTAGDVNGDGYADLIVGAPLWDDVFASQGRAYVYHGSATGLSATADWVQEGSAFSTLFAIAAGTAGDVNGDGYADVIVGTHRFDGEETDEGKAWVYHGSASGLAAVASWSAEGNQENSGFGRAVATAGDVNGDGFSDVVVGAYLYDAGEPEEGRAYVYHGAADGLAPTADWTADSDQAEAYLGGWVRSAGDVNGDGYADIIVAAQYYDSGQVDEGRVWVYHGSPTGPWAANWTAEGDQDGASFGATVSSAGDVDGDGYADVIVGATSYDNGETNEGRAFLYRGSPAGLSVAPSWTAEGDQQGAAFGRVAAAGDVNGDGYADVFVGASSHDIDATTFNVGRGYVYHGGPAGLSAGADWIVEGTQSGEFVGISGGTAGDVDGDGYSDVIVGAHGLDNGNQNEGRASLYLGGVGGLAASAAWTAEGNQDGANLGWRVGTAGDVNGDGHSDVIVSAYRHDNAQANAGKVYVYHGHGGGLWTTAAWTGEGTVADAEYGTDVGTAGDVNGDGYSDIIVGVPGFERAYVYLGSALGLEAVEAWSASSDQPGADFGSSVGSAGDVDGDGYADVVVGSRLFDNGETNEGQVYVFLSDSPGRTVKPRQLRVGSGAPIGALGASDAVDSFGIEMAGFTPFGRGDIALEVEAKPLGTPFDGTNTSRSSYVDSGLAGNVFSEVVSSLVEETGYHWRARILYDAATAPFQGHGPWITIPRNGWRETDLRTDAVTGAGALDADDPAGQVQVEITEEGNIRISWGGSCTPTDEDFAVYVGTLGDFTSHVPETCSTGGLQYYEYPPDPVDTYYLVVPVDIQSASEGSYGMASDGNERPAQPGACYEQAIEASCAP